MIDFYDDTVSYVTSANVFPTWWGITLELYDRCFTALVGILFYILIVVPLIRELPNPFSFS